jgi:hypothetical protein
MPWKYCAHLTIKTVRGNADFSSGQLNAIRFPDIHRTDKEHSQGVVPKYSNHRTIR